MLTICGQTGERRLYISVDVPRTPSKTSHPRIPAAPRDRKERSVAPTFCLKDWRVAAGYSFRAFADLTGIDIALLKRAEDRAAGKDIKNHTKGVDIGIIYAYADALELPGIEPLRRKPDDPPTEIERFAAAPAELREDIVRMISRLPKT